MVIPCWPQPTKRKVMHLFFVQKLFYIIFLNFNTQIFKKGKNEKQFKNLIFFNELIWEIFIQINFVGFFLFSPNYRFLGSSSIIDLHTKLLHKELYSVHEIFVGVGRGAYVTRYIIFLRRCSCRFFVFSAFVDI